MGLRGAWAQIDLAHRLGPYNKGKTRPIVVKFKTHNAKMVTYQHCFNLSRESGIYINLHLPDEIKYDHVLMDKITKFAKNYDNQASRVGDKVAYKGLLYSIEDIQKSDLPVKDIHQTELNGVIGFLGKLSPFSNFFKCELEIDKRHYTSVEKYFQQKRAEDAGDIKVAAEISLQDDPASIKNTAKKIRMPDGTKPVFNPDRDKEIMSKALRAKFSHEPLKQELLETGTKLLVEANEHSLYWGGGGGGIPQIKGICR